MKKKFKALVVIVIFCFIGILAFRYFNISNELSEMQSKENERQILQNEIDSREIEENERRLQEKLINKNVENANNFVNNISKETKFILLTLSGNYSAKHDRTPENNNLTEWLVNSEIKMELNYEAIFVIAVSDIEFVISDIGNVKICFNLSDINIEAIDISNINTKQNVSVFGKSYMPSEVVALESIIKYKIYEDVFNDTNISSAGTNLVTLLEGLALSFNVERVEITNKN